MDRGSPSQRPMRHMTYVLCLWVSISLGACSWATERVAGWYVTRQIDSYLDLTSAQKKATRARVDVQLLALRRDELPRWLHTLRMTRNLIARDSTEAEVSALQRRYDGLLDDAVDNLAPELAALLAQLDDRQIAHFQARLHERLEETYEDLKLPRKKRQEKTEERAIDAVESLVGDLDDAQKVRIRRALLRLPDELPVRYEVERKRIEAAGQFLRTHPGEAAIEAELRRLWRTRYEELGAGRDLVSRRAEQRRLLLDLHAMLTVEQRATAVENLNKMLRRLKRFSLRAPG